MSTIRNIARAAALALLAVTVHGCKRQGSATAEPQQFLPASPASTTPYGVWTTVGTSPKISLQFAGSPGGGTYSQIAESDAGIEREFGHWVPEPGGVRMLIMATDRRSHPRFGKDTSYRIRYYASGLIIDGPDRPDLRLIRAPEGTTVDVTPNKN